MVEVKVVSVAHKRDGSKEAPAERDRDHSDRVGLLDRMDRIDRL